MPGFRDLAESFAHFTERSKMLWTTQRYGIEATGKAEGREGRKEDNCKAS